jgi:chloramphenicol 3-O phosphotransferase
MTITASHEVVAEERAGRVILLNGTSSSGKSSIAAELLDQLDGPWFHLGIDGFHRLRSRQAWTEEEFLPIFQRTVLGFHRAVAGMVAAGNDVVMDYVLGERWRLTDCLSVFQEHQGPVRRRPLLAPRTPTPRTRPWQPKFPLVHQHGIYDIEVDTEHHTPAECATQIRTRLLQSPPTAFTRLRT